jgi:xylulokinase
MFLGIDVGTGGTRAVVIDAAGRVVATATADHAPFASPQAGWAEQDPRDWWRATAEAVRAVLTGEKVAADSIAAVGFSGQMHGATLLDAADEPLRPALIWCDQRTEKQCRELTAQIGAERLIELVCNPAITGFTLPKLLWLRENEPDLWRQACAVLLPKDYVRLRLTGDKATDVADASGTLLFDVRRRKWSETMFAELGLDAALFPRAFESIEVTGNVSAAGAAATGLRAGTPVVAGAGDNAAGAVGMGIVQAGQVSVTIGTSGVAFVVTDKPTLDARGRTHTLCHAIPNRWHKTGVTQGAGLSLRWFRDHFGCGASFDELTAEAEKTPAGAEGLFWLPYLMGERTPHRNPTARAAFIGLTARHTRAHLVRAVLEGVAFSLRDCLEIFRELGLPLANVRLGGGGAKSALWRQIQADVYGQSVATIEAEEGAALGAAILAGVGAGAWPTVDEACRQAIRVAATIAPQPAAVALYDRQFARYQQLYPAVC